MIQKSLATFLSFYQTPCQGPLSQETAASCSHLFALILVSDLWLTSVRKRDGNQKESQKIGGKKREYLITGSIPESSCNRTGLRERQQIKNFKRNFSATTSILKSYRVVIAGEKFLIVRDSYILKSHNLTSG